MNYNVCKISVPKKIMFCVILLFMLYGDGFLIMRFIVRLNPA